MSDIVERLHRRFESGVDADAGILWEAADTIERLMAALEMGLQLGESGKHGDGESCPTCHFVREARKALGLEATSLSPGK